MYTISLLVFCSALYFMWSHNPVHAVLTLVVTGLGFAGYLLNAGLEFTAFIVVLVYVGAVTVLFIFVVMMVNLRSTSNSFVLIEALPIWVILEIGLLSTGLNDSLLLSSSSIYNKNFNSIDVGNKFNLFDLGGMLYNSERMMAVFFVSLVLLVAMIAAICLSLVSSENYRTQDFYTQIRRSNAIFGFHKKK